MRIYISGPITNNKAGYKEEFGKAEAILRKNGLTIINPANLNLVLPDDASHDEYMRVCIEILDMADAVCMLPGWEESKGARIEYGYALGRDKIIASLEQYIHEDVPPEKILPAEGESQKTDLDDEQSPHPLEEPAKPKRPSGRKKKEIEYEKLKAYVESGKTNKEIAVLEGVSIDVVRRWMQEHRLVGVRKAGRKKEQKETEEVKEPIP